MDTIGIDNNLDRPRIKKLLAISFGVHRCFILGNKGFDSTAICYASVIEEEAIEQICYMCDYEFTEGNRIRIMPDVHAGKGCTIGTTMTVVDKACPTLLALISDAVLINV